MLQQQLGIQEQRQDEVRTSRIMGEIQILVTHNEKIEVRNRLNTASSWCK